MGSQTPEIRPLRTRLVLLIHRRTLGKPLPSPGPCFPIWSMKEQDQNILKVPPSSNMP